MNNLKICVVGLGVMGKLHLSKLINFNGVEVCGVDTAKDRIAEVSKQFNVPVYKNIKDVSGNVDMAVIATPTVTHYSLAKSLIEEGVHLFVEKPLAENSRFARKLWNLARKKGVIFQVGHIERFNPAFLRTKELLKNPSVLAFYRLSPFPDRSMDVDVVMDLMIHDIDLAFNIRQGKIKKIESFGAKFVSRNVDFAVAKIFLDNGCNIYFVSNRVYFKKVRQIYAFERDKQIVSDLLNMKLSVISPENGGAVIEEEKVKKYDMIEKELSSFINSVRTKKPPPVTGEDGCKAIEIAECIRRKMRII